jgi:hypothetical protein
LDLKISNLFHYISKDKEENIHYWWIESIDEDRSCGSLFEYKEKHPITSQST